MDNYMRDSGKYLGERKEKDVVKAAKINTKRNMLNTYY